MLKQFKLISFQINAPLIEPTFSQNFHARPTRPFYTSNKLNACKSQWRPSVFEGEITDYRITPMSATAKQTAAQNRLTISVNVNVFIII